MFAVLIILLLVTACAIHRQTSEQVYAFGAVAARTCANAVTCASVMLAQISSAVYAFGACATHTKYTSTSSLHAAAAGKFAFVGLRNTHKVHKH